MTTEESKNFAAAIKRFFSKEERDFYLIQDNDFDTCLMARQFNELSESEFSFSLLYDEHNVPMIWEEEMALLCEWLEESGWINED